MGEQVVPGPGQFAGEPTRNERDAATGTTYGDLTEGTIDEVLARVGDDQAKARVALEQEQAKDKPRKSLVEQLQAIAEGE